MTFQTFVKVEPSTDMDFIRSCWLVGVRRIAQATNLSPSMVSRWLDGQYRLNKPAYIKLRAFVRTELRKLPLHQKETV